MGVSVGNVTSAEDIWSLAICWRWGCRDWVQQIVSLL